MALKNACSSTLAGTTIGPEDLDAKAVTQAKLNDEAVFPMNVGLACRNETSGTLSVGTLVYVNSWSETYTRPLLAKADADSAAAGRATWVVVTAMADATNGVVGKQYRLTAQATNGAAVGDPVYLSTTAGGWTLTAPTAADATVQIIGRVAVVHASAGEIEIDLAAHSAFKSIGQNQIQAAAITGALASTVMATKSVTVPFSTIATTGAQELLVQAPAAGTLIAARFVGKDALATDNTNYLTFALTNKGQAGAGSTAMLSATASGTTQTTGGAAIAAYTSRNLPLHATGGNATVAANDCLALSITATGTLGNTVTEPSIRLDFQVTT
jgi:hypothetical protein